MSRHPIPAAALDDRLGIVGTAGSGKTYTAMECMERLLDRGNRVGGIDALGVMYGLRLMADGKTPSPYSTAPEGTPKRLVIFGGPRGDLPLTEHSGALIGETCARMAESWLVDLSEIGTKAGERRFVLNFLTALYRHTTKEPLHLIFDEADMWAPQGSLRGEEGEAAKLLGMMETIVRRGRVKGFIPWLISQRPAVLSKNVLSQVDGLIAMKLTSSQDREQLGAWIEGQADKNEGKRILGMLPEKQKGEGIVWIPARGILDENAKFPAKTTFDSSRAPKRGEKPKAAKITPLDIDALREKLATVETEIKANDPRELRAKVAALARANSDLEQRVANAEAGGGAAKKGSPEAKETQKRIDAARKAYEDMVRDVIKGVKAASVALQRQMEGIDPLIERLRSTYAKAQETLDELLATITAKVPQAPITIAAPAQARQPRASRAPSAMPQAVADGLELKGPERRILGSLVLWKNLGHDQPTRAQVAFLARYSPDGSSFTNPLGALKTGGRIDYPGPGRVTLLNPEGADDLGAPDAQTLVGYLRGPEQRILNATRQGRATRAVIAERSNYSPDGSSFTNPLGRLRTLDLIDYPAAGEVDLTPWALELFGTLHANT